MATKQIINKPKCPRCDSSQVYLRIKEQKFICRSCGNDWARNGKGKP